MQVILQVRQARTAATRLWLTCNSGKPYYVQQAVTQPPLDPLAVDSPLFNEPIEALAGKGWRQMAREAAQRQDEEIAERVRSLWRTPAAPKPPPFSLSSLVSRAGLVAQWDLNPLRASLLLVSPSEHRLQCACQTVSSLLHGRLAAREQSHLALSHDLPCSSDAAKACTWSLAPWHSSQSVAETWLWHLCTACTQ